MCQKEIQFDAKVVESRRTRTNVNYKLHVTVKDETPWGENPEQLTLVTEDPSNPYIPLWWRAASSRESP